MQVNGEEKQLLQKAVTEWKQSGLITEEQADKMAGSIELKPEGIQSIAKYFFIIAISCIVLAFGAIFIDEKLLEKVKAYFSLSNIFIALFFAIASVAWFWYCKKKVANTGSFAYETYMVLGALLSLVALVYGCKDLGFGEAHSGFLLLVTILMGTLSILFRSSALWIGTILAIMGWFGSFSTAHQHKYLFLGMNYPVRFTLFGLLVIGFSFVQASIKPIADSRRTTYLVGLLIFFTALWGVSVFGNYNDWSAWAAVRQTQVIVYATISGLISIATFFLGIRYRDNLTRDFGLIFLLINLYTRYFEFFWEGMNKGIFFIILAISFYGVGKWIERRRSLHKANTAV
jgi:uncharacterized membrane protein